MAHSVIWPKKKFFYPIGNTSPVSFTQNLAPEISAKILLLGCGDPRSILYTIHADLGSSQRSLDFTCCDAEPAILARNVLLLTLILDDGSPARIEHIWNIFFHFYLDKQSLELLRGQCRKLVDLSCTIQSWTNSKYSSILRVCSQHTLSELRRHWTMYEETEDLSRNDKEELRSLFVNGMQSVKDRFTDTSVMTAARSAGPLWTYVLLPGSASFSQFWETGVTFDDATLISDATYINPTFAYDASGRGFNVHYGTDPILAFHLSMTANLPSFKDRAPNVSDLVQLAKTQFQSWCASLRRRVASTTNVVIRLLVGDALACSQAISFCAQSESLESGFYITPWDGTQVKLDGGDYDGPMVDRAPVSFNVIDTSNLTDHLGLLNILIVTLPILQRTPAALLHTNTLLTTEDTVGTPGGFTFHACADIPTISLLLGVVPVSYVSGFTSQSTAHARRSLGSQGGTRQETISWKCSPLMEDASEGPQPRVQIEFQHLGKILFDIYLRMFADFKEAESKPSFPHYIRASFVAFLTLVKQKICTNWTEAVEHMLSLLWSDKALVRGGNYYQDLCCQLHLYGVYTVAALVGKTFGNPEKSVFKHWTRIPPVVCIVLEVPRQYLKVLEGVSIRRIGTPILQCEIEGLTFHNFFSSIQSFFGKTVVSKSDPDQLLVDEDQSRWAGKSPLIVSFYAPSWILGEQPTSTKMHFSVRAESVYCESLYDVLGPKLRVFSADLMDERHVSIVPERPGNLLELKRLSGTFVADSNSNREAAPALLEKGHVCMLIDKASSTACGLTARANILDEASRSALRSCRTADVQIKQTSPFSMRVSFAPFDRVLTFPYPIDGAKYKFRIARKSCYIEVDVGLCRPSLQGLTTNPFPFVTNNSTPTIWNFHYLNLTRSPILHITKQDWLASHLSLSLSDNEQISLKTLPRSQRSLLTNMKSKIACMYRQIVDPQAPAQLFIICDPLATHSILFFPNFLRLDLASHTVVADMCVLPLTKSILRIDAVQQLLLRVHRPNSCNPFTAIADDAEMKGWWQLLPVLAERCRDWPHLTTTTTGTCSYLKAGGPPLQFPDHHLITSPFCGCGLGMSLPSKFLEGGEWKEMAPYVTRIALSPLFALSYLDLETVTMGSEARERVLELGNFGGCDACGGRGLMMRCSACAQGTYCSRTCQKEDWKFHKVVCKQKKKKKP
ncbi:hypothetical protein D9615_000827 [Tricholomella constricta]|uniref:MYND-type domain-containing protein n=1 Tax=Tricholomella constricta TaxID=117010 RepID=A0A8H5HRN6_9AGAR|nr:hypothetical protein D9615_000827 [Tricholomella constricta]